MADVLVKTNLTAVVAPGITDDSGSGYSIFSPWLDVTADELYWCMDASVGAAVWLRVTNLTAAEIEAIVNHDNLVGFVAAEHVDWAASGAGTIHATNYVDNNDDTTDHTLLSNIGTNTHAQIDTHVALTSEHIDWTADQGATNIDAGNLPVAAITSGTVTGITDLAIADGGTASSTAQAAIDLLSAVAGATAEHVLTKDTGTGNAIFKAAAGGGLANIVEDVTPQLGAQLDVNGFGLGDGTLELLSFIETVSAINEITITNAAIGNDPDISATGDDTNIGISFTPKGTGNITLGTMVLDSDQTIGAGQDNYVLTYDDAGGLISLEAAGGGGSPGGSDTEVQYNNATAFGGMSNVTYNNATSVITIAWADELSGLVASGTDTDALDLTIKVPVSTGTADPGAVIIQTTDLIGAISGTTPQTLQDRFRIVGHRIEVLNSGGSIGIGENAGQSDDLSNNFNVWIGTNAGQAAVTSSNSVGVGNKALFDVTAGDGNFALGTNALANNVTGSNNVAIGVSAALGLHGDSINETLALGKGALQLVQGNGNIGLGFLCGNNLTTGVKCLLIGYNIDAPSGATTNNQMSIGNLLFSEGIDGTGTTVSTGNLGVAIPSPQEKLQVPDSISISDATEGNTARLTRRTAHETHTLAAAGTSDTTTISIPSGAKLLAVSFNVDTAVTDDDGDNTWSAAFVTGSTTILATAAAAAQNTKVDLFLPYEISTGVCEIRFTANGTNFTAGAIEIVAYYESLTSLANV